MHVTITTKCLVFVCVVTLGSENEVRGEFGVTIQCTYTFKHIPEVDVKGFPSDHDLLAFEFWSGWEGVYDFVELICILV